MRRLRRAILVVLVLAAAAPALAQTLRVTAGTTNLRAKPTADSDIVATLSKGAELEAIDKDGAWYRVRVKSSGAEGFVHNLVVEQVAVTSPAPSAAPPPPAPSTPNAGTPPAALPQTAAATGPRRQFFVRPAAGFLAFEGGVGFVIGAGIAGTPFGTEQAEVAGDFSFVNFEGASGAYGSGNFIYNFRLQGQQFTPFAGAGLGIFNGGGETDFGFQVLGGIQAPINDRMAFRGEIRFVFIEGSAATIVLGGISF